MYSWSKPKNWCLCYHSLSFQFSFRWGINKSIYPISRNLYYLVLPPILKTTGSRLFIHPLSPHQKWAPNASLRQSIRTNFIHDEISSIRQNHQSALQRFHSPLKSPIKSIRIHEFSIYHNRLISFTRDSPRMAWNTRYNHNPSHHSIRQLHLEEKR